MLLKIEDSILLKPYSVPWLGKLNKHKRPPPGWTPSGQAPKSLPWPGWVPVGLGQDDRRIRKAYRELFIRLNPEKGTTLTPRTVGGSNTIWPPDGMYIYEKGVMREYDKSS